VSYQNFCGRNTKEKSGYHVRTSFLTPQDEVSLCGLHSRHYFLLLGTITVPLAHAHPLSPTLDATENKQKSSIFSKIILSLISVFYSLPSLLVLSKKRIC